MKFSVGYPINHTGLFIKTVEDYKRNISEVYFSFDDFPNGRNSKYLGSELSKWDVMDQKREYLQTISRFGIKLNLLLNGNCYGKNAQSRSFFHKIGETILFLKNLCGLSCVTTTSPLIAKFIKLNFEDVEVRASVNMEIGTSQGMDYVSDLFDSFYLKREYNRDLVKLQQARSWCDSNGKKLYGLANSGCLNFCSTHTFHDNLVSHESEISEMDNAYQFQGQCWDYLRKSDKRENWLSLTNFIRPEDVTFYENIFDGLKLATRVNKAPFRVIEAYCRGSFNGAITEMLEPDHSGLFYPFVIDNKSIISDFTKTVMECSKNCNECQYCRDVQKNATVAL